MSEPEFCVVLKQKHVLSEEIYTTRAKNFTLPRAVTGMTNFTSDHTIGGNGGAAARPWLIKSAPSTIPLDTPVTGMDPYRGCLIVVDGNHLLTVLDFMAVNFVLEECTIANEKSLIFCRDVILTMFWLKQWKEH